jgi:hypothetical protein
MRFKNFKTLDKKQLPRFSDKIHQKATKGKNFTKKAKPPPSRQHTYATCPAYYTHVKNETSLWKIQFVLWSLVDHHLPIRLHQHRTQKWPHWNLNNKSFPVTYSNGSKVQASNKILPYTAKFRRYRKFSSKN